MANSAILAIRIVADAGNAARGLRRTSSAVRQFQRDVDTLTGGASGAFAAMGTQILHVGTMFGVATAAAAPLIGVVGSLAIGAAGLGAVAAPALATVALGFDGIQAAAKSIAPQFDALKSSVSSTFEQGMTPAFQKLGGLMESLTPAFQGIASSLSGVFGSVIDQMTGPGASAIQTLLDGSRQFVESLGPGLTSLTDGLLQFGATAGEQGAAFGASLGSILKTIGDGLAQVPPELFTGFNQALAGLNSLLGPIIGLMTELGVVIGPIVGEAFRILGEVITSMTPALSEIGGTVGQSIVTIMEALAPVMPQIAQSFSDLLTAIAPLIEPLASFAAAMAGDLSGALDSILPGIESMSGGLGNLLGFLEPAAGLIGGAAIAWGAAEQGLAAYNTVQGLATTAEEIYTAAGNIKDKAMKIWTATQWAFNAAMSANPLGLIIAAILILIGIIVLVATKTQFFQTVWEIMKAVALAVWEAIKNAVQSGIDKIQLIITWVQERLGAAWEGMKAGALAVWEGIKGFIQGGIDKIQDIINWVQEKLVGAWERAKEVATGVWQAIKDGIQSVIDFISRLIDKITGIRFPSPPGWMTSLFGGSAEAEFKFLPPDVMRFIPETYSRFDAAPADITAASSAGLGLGTAFSNGSSGNVVQHVTNVNITIEGAIDSLSAAKEIKKLLRDQGITVGNTNARSFN